MVLLCYFAFGYVNTYDILWPANQLDPLDLVGLFLGVEELKRWNSLFYCKQRHHDVVVHPLRAVR